MMIELGMRLPRWHLVVENLPANAGGIKRLGFNPWIRKIRWRKKWQPTPVFLPRESHGQRRLAGSSPHGRKDGGSLFSYIVYT